ncbi:hypothetical protein JAAARDRAFT_197967 [Jaapia argillacea MUCL 33604]|uniref:C2H2-type domain-containing protein n=1 Tax=Jaapia argillacea MUCL 33604 TaxID=933084 RepID=A0A067PRG6_9AGAM|nr:hypothetical protein JAAARDRAFT_197967 [Jaapia argillacea MUCL 33604]
MSYHTPNSSTFPVDFDEIYFNFNAASTRSTQSQEVSTYTYPPTYSNQYPDTMNAFEAALDSSLLFSDLSENWNNLNAYYPGDSLYTDVKQAEPIHDQRYRYYAPHPLVDFFTPGTAEETSASATGPVAPAPVSFPPVAIFSLDNLEDEFPESLHQDSRTETPREETGVVSEGIDESHLAESLRASFTPVAVFSLDNLEEEFPDSFSQGFHAATAHDETAVLSEHVDQSHFAEPLSPSPSEFAFHEGTPSLTSDSSTTSGGSVYSASAVSSRLSTPVPFTQPLRRRSNRIATVASNCGSTSSRCSTLPLPDDDSDFEIEEKVSRTSRTKRKATPSDFDTSSEREDGPKSPRPKRRRRSGGRSSSYKPSSSSRIYPCTGENCGKTFTREADLLRHLNTVIHGDRDLNDEEIYKIYQEEREDHRRWCEWCYCILARPDSRRRHEAVPEACEKSPEGKKLREQWAMMSDEPFPRIHKSRINVVKQMPRKRS